VQEIDSSILDIKNYGFEESDYSLGSIDATRPIISRGNTEYGPYYINVTTRGGLRQINSVRVEKRLGNIVPDLVLDIVNENGTASHEVIVEIFVTHKVDENKLKKIKDLRLPTLEIDLSAQYKTWLENPTNLLLLKNIFSNPVDEKKWVYMLGQEQMIEKEIKKRKEIDRAGPNRIEVARQYESSKRAFQQKIVAYLLPDNADKFTQLHAEELTTNDTWLKIKDKYQIDENTLSVVTNIPIEGEVMFGCDRKLWQSAVFYHYVCSVGKFTCMELKRYALEITRKTWLRGIPRYGAAERYEQDMDTRITDFLVLDEVILQYVNKLVEYEYIKPVSQFRHTLNCYEAGSESIFCQMYNDYITNLESVHDEFQLFREKNEFNLWRRNYESTLSLGNTSVLPTDEIILLIEQQIEPAHDSDGNRWIKCEKCGCIDTEAEFVIYGGPNHVNLGICYKCREKS